MRNIKVNKSLAALVVTALVTTLAVAVPTAANASTSCSKASFTSAGKSVSYQKCTGTDWQGSKYEIRMPSKFNGMMYLYSHGIRGNHNMPKVPVIRPNGYIVDMAPEVAPGRTVADQEFIAQELLKQGYAVAGSGVSTQGWSVPEAVDNNLQLIVEARSKFPNIKKIVSWGDSLGGHISQSLSEKYDVIDAAANLHMAGSADSQYTYANDFLWMFKTFFDPTIKGNGYSSGTAGYMEYMGDITKVLTAFGTIQAAIAADPLAPKWPATSKVPAALQAIPVRSAVLLVGLLAGVPVQSNTYDASSGPAGPLETSFGLAISPALGVFENAFTALALALIGNYDAEVRCGGTIFDNTATDYAARLGDNGDVYAAGLSGKTATAGMLAYLNKLNPAAPRVKGTPAALNCIKNDQANYTGAVTIPTITISQTADQVTPAGFIQKFKELYEENVASGTAKKGMLLNIWNKPPDTYTKFDTAGKPITPAIPTTGTSHLMYTNADLLIIAKMLANAGKTGKLPSMATAKSAIKKNPNMFIDPDFKPELMFADR
jgi:dienelactone hydrolase